MQGVMPNPIARRALLGLLGTGAVAVATSIALGGRPSRKPEFYLSDAQWRQRLGAARFHILRQGGTERPFTSPLLREKRRGIYACAGCGRPLFSSAAKYDSGTGWPSFWKPLPDAVAYQRDLGSGIVRTEESCRRCGGHLGHVFDDGPPPTGKRHCINGLSLVFKPESQRA